MDETSLLAAGLPMGAMHFGGKATTNVTLSFYVLAHDGDPRGALAMKRTWLSGERTHLVVAPDTPHVHNPDLYALKGLKGPRGVWPSWAPFPNAGTSVNGSHPRDAKGCSKKDAECQRQREDRLGSLNTFLRAKVFAILLRMATLARGLYHTS